MEKKKNKGIIVLIVVLILCIVGLVLYILVDKDIIKWNSTTAENKQVEEKITSDDTEKDDTRVELDPENANIKYLFDTAHFGATGVDAHVYRDGGYKVSEMSEEDKIALLGRQWYPLVEHYSTGTSPNLTTTYYLDEDTLKDVYERTFGPNTYSTVNQIYDGLCVTLNYDATNKRYSYIGSIGCGGTSAFGVHEKIISAIKYSDRIEIVSATVYLDGMSNQMYKDYNKTTSLGELLVDENTVNNREERENTYNQYIEENKDNLEQYKYTYNLNEDGFYYLTSVERTKV